VFLRTAIEGQRKFAAMAIVCGCNGACSPCGAYRQIMWEFAPELEIILDDGCGDRSSVELPTISRSPLTGTNSIPPAGRRSSDSFSTVLLSAAVG